MACACCAVLLVVLFRRRMDGSEWLALTIGRTGGEMRRTRRAPPSSAFSIPLTHFFRSSLGRLLTTHNNSPLSKVCLYLSLITTLYSVCILAYYHIIFRGASFGIGVWAAALAMSEPFWRLIRLPGRWRYSEMEVLLVCDCGDVFVDVQDLGSRRS